MKRQSLPPTISYDELISVFTVRSGNELFLPPAMGTGSVKRFYLEKGLQARLWDCSFFNDLEMHTSYKQTQAKQYFTIAYFFDGKELKFAKGVTPFRKSMWCDHMFLSAISDYRLLVPRFVRLHCLSISFSMNWVNTILDRNTALANVREKIQEPGILSLAGTMELSEREQIARLKSEAERYTGSFFIKCSILQIISNFFCKLNDQDKFFTSNPCTNSITGKVAGCLK